MPPKSQGDAIRELEIGLAVLNERVESIQETIRDADVADITSQLNLLRHRVDEFQKGAEEADRRRWQIVAAGIASVFALVVNLILLGLRK